MTDINSTRITNRQSANFQAVSGTGLQLYAVGSKPPGPWFKLDSSGQVVAYDIPEIAYSAGSMVSVFRNDGPDATYNQLYVYVEAPEGHTGSWEPWKKVDLIWPKIDPRTGEPYDQYLEWYSPLAE